MLDPYLVTFYCEALEFDFLVVADVGFAAGDGDLLGDGVDAGEVGEQQAALREEAVRADDLLDRGTASRDGAHPA